MNLSDYAHCGSPRENFFSNVSSYVSPFGNFSPPKSFPSLSPASHPIGVTKDCTFCYEPHPCECDRAQADTDGWDVVTPFPISAGGERERERVREKFGSGRYERVSSFLSRSQRERVGEGGESRKGRGKGFGGVGERERIGGGERRERKGLNDVKEKRGTAMCADEVDIKYELVKVRRLCYLCAHMHIHTHVHVKHTHTHTHTHTHSMMHR